MKKEEALADFLINRLHIEPDQKTDLVEVCKTGNPDAIHAHIMALLNASLEDITKCTK